jgi:hypothetical protein
MAIVPAFHGPAADLPTRRQGKIAVPLRVSRNGAVDIAAGKDMQMTRAQKRALRALM